MKNGVNERQFQHVMKRKLDQSHSSGEDRWKNMSLREFDGPLSLEERRVCKTPPEVQRSELRSREMTKTKKDTEQHTQSKALQCLR